jgi:hypothetical protein
MWDKYRENEFCLDLRKLGRCRLRYETSFPIIYIMVDHDPQIAALEIIRSLAPPGTVDKVWNLNFIYVKWWVAKAYLPRNSCILWFTHCS